MKIAQRLTAAWRGLMGQPAKRADPYAGTYGSGAAAGFAGGSIGRLTASLASWSGSINADLDASLPVLRARARNLAANNEHGRRFVGMVAANVVGRRNPRLQVRALRDQRNPDKPTTLDKSANDTIETHWERWGKTADITGRHRSLYALFRTVATSVARDGEALVRIVRNRRLPYGMGLQLLEADRLDEARNLRLDNGNSVRQGVEIDSAGRAVAYWVKTAHPGEAYSVAATGVERIPAADIRHVFLTDRAEQVRGVTWFHPIIIRASIIHNFEEAAVTAAQIGASKIAALERAEDATDATASMADGAVGNALQMNVQAGEMFELPPGYKLNSWNPEYPHANFESFLKACLRGLAAGLGVAAHNLTGDMTDVNYSSARIAELAERETWMLLQDWFIESFVQPVYEDWLALALLSGAITFDGSGKAIPADRYAKFLNASRFQGRRWAWVDPLKEAEANSKLLETQLTSRTRLAAEQGEEFEDILDELAQEESLIEDAGLTLAPAKAAAAPPAVPPAPTSDPQLAKAISLVLARFAEPPAAPAPITVSPPAVTIHQGAIHVAPAAVTVEPAAVTVENRMPEQPTPNVEVRVEALMPEQPAPVVEVNVETPDEIRITSMPTRVTTSDVARNMAGEITSAKQIETDVI